MVGWAQGGGHWGLFEGNVVDALLHSRLIITCERRRPFWKCDVTRDLCFSFLGCVQVLVTWVSTVQVGQFLPDIDWLSISLCWLNWRTFHSWWICADGVGLCWTWLGIQWLLWVHGSEPILAHPSWTGLSIVARLGRHIPDWNDRWTCRSSQGSPCLGSKARQVKSNLDLVLVTEGLAWVEKLTQQHVQLKGIGFH